MFLSQPRTTAARRLPFMKSIIYTYVALAVQPWVRAKAATEIFSYWKSQCLLFNSAGMRMLLHIETVFSFFSQKMRSMYLNFLPMRHNMKLDLLWRELATIIINRSQFWCIFFPSGIADCKSLGLLTRHGLRGSWFQLDGMSRKIRIFQSNVLKRFHLFYAD